MRLADFTGPGNLPLLRGLSLWLILHYRLACQRKPRDIIPFVAKIRPNLRPMTRDVQPFPSADTILVRNPTGRDRTCDHQNHDAHPFFFHIACRVYWHRGPGRSSGQPLAGAGLSSASCKDKINALSVSH
jgi:hypothetical protein